eukprot:TRINITY_DN8008_c1_g1_i1.p1 TRINITY_DN8008_c1_g1~~TRINITY_DN8008_c1_g1_i1.p1  ORF type:complete len:178 (+),score=56.63 TRINITY_DN8008_c1_g1_i1:118-651(+)
MAERVQELQRTDQAFCSQWERHCRLYGESSGSGRATFDPRRYGTAFLERALMEIRGTADQLAKAVNAAQRASPRFKAHWERLCADAEHSPGSYDPCRRSAGFLRAALAEVADDDAADVPEVCRALAQAINAEQKASAEFKAAYTSLCDEAAGGRYNPRQHPIDVLLRALDLMSDGGA